MQRIWALIQLPVTTVMLMEVYTVKLGRKKGYNGKWTLVTTYLYCLFNVIMLGVAFTEGALLPLALLPLTGLYFSCYAMSYKEKASEAEQLVTWAQKLFQKKRPP